MSEISDVEKKNIWAFYVMSRSSDPTIMIPNTRKLVSCLRDAARVVEDKRFDKILAHAENLSNQAHIVYQDEHNWARAVVMCENVIDNLMIMINQPDQMYAIQQSSSFVSIPKKVEQ
jgi:hypothetical protein